MAKRRASGEENIRKRSDGRWEGRYVAGHDECGNPIREITQKNDHLEMFYLYNNS